ncbi:putative membrane protein [Desulfocurvibacter africanus PCS]|uniref:Putative membrane protein n=1 Tax=Desulfocurvibacter africanus PCS TaxID=1262666 RepID=M5Q0V6_DESAF|nr:rhomboid family intramembrane serine protease [Desulfocurvibacter africanus]EMG37036.1 putative membrane protein [Desulfocurvibacter africanus PCS]
MPSARDPDALRKAMAAQRSRRREEPPRRRSPSSPEPADAGQPVSDDWLDVSSPLNAGRPLPYSVAFEWDLALTARGVAHRAERHGGGWRILAPDREAGQAMAELTAYRAENRPGRSGIPLPRHENRTATLLALAVLLTFFVLTRTYLPALGLYPYEWDELGSAQAGHILDGEWWRLATALTLHADAAHVLGNVVVGALFIVPICQTLGSGQGWLLVLLSGVVGNLVNAFVQGPGHDSIGFSTCVFGAAGILAGLRARTGSGRSPWFTAVAAGLALLAVLGVGGERTDVGAHLFGFLAGLALGLFAGWRLLHLGPVGRLTGAFLAMTAALVPLAAWLWAFLSH